MLFPRSQQYVLAYLIHTRHMYALLCNRSEMKIMYTSGCILIASFFVTSKWKIDIINEKTYVGLKLFTEVLVDYEEVSME